MASDQYDSIGLRFNSVDDMPSNDLNLPSVLAVLPDVRGLNCLDLACGLGRYSVLLAEKGANTVVGVDISQQMIDAARNKVTQRAAELSTKIRYNVVDCSKPVTVDGSPFDLVFAGWFFNYAPDAETLQVMWRNVHDNLRPGGQLVAVVPNLDLNMEDPLDGRYGMTARAIGEVKDGWKLKLTALTDPPFEFETYHLIRKVYERCVREAGMIQLRTHSHVIPDDERKTSGFWDVYNARPHFEIWTAMRPI